MISAIRHSLTGSIVRIMCLCCLPGLTSTVFADDVSSDDALLADLFQELEQVTAIATRTKLNIDYVPGMVTVLRGRDLERQGIFTLLDALQTVPGVEITMSSDGQTNYVMRGIGKIFSSGKVKMLINGRAQNTAMNGGNAVRIIPMQLVERIEVIRGPGSAIYGEYAYAGLINIVMRKDTRLFLSANSLNDQQIGGSWSNYESDASIKYALSLSALESEGKSVIAGPDYLKATPAFSDISNTPGYSNEAQRQMTSSLQLSYKGFLWDTIFQQHQMGDLFGFQNALPEKVELTRKTVSLTSDIDKTFKITEHLSAVATAGALFYKLRSKPHYFLPVGFPHAPVIDSVTGEVDDSFEQGVLGSPNYSQYETRTNLELNYTGIKYHNLLFGFHAAYIKQGDTWARRNQEMNNGVMQEIELKNYRGDENWLRENNVRKVTSVYVQDQWMVTRPLTVTLGARYDNYFKSGDSFNPRLAAVYNLFDNHLFKFQLSRAFRPPNFFEMYMRNNIVAEGNENIKSETIESVELGYIYNRLNTTFRLTSFYSRLDDLITINEITKKYENTHAAISRGAELEISQTFLNVFQLDANATFVRIKDEETDQAFPMVANVYGYASLSYQPMDHMTVILSDQYVGKRKRENNDPRPAMRDYNIVNLIVSFENVMLKRASINMGIKNIFDEPVLHPAPMVSFDGNLLPSYVGDYPRPGRSVWLNLVYHL